MKKPELMTDGVLKSIPEETTEFMKFIDEMIEKKSKKPDFMNCCPCCGKPLIIRRDGIYYTIEEFEEIDFDGGDTDGDKNKEHKRLVDIL